jgi:hypothetical protein
MVGSGSAAQLGFRSDACQRIAKVLPQIVPRWGATWWGIVMSDPNLDDFHGRIARIERSRAKGLGFEAAGTLGRSRHARPAPRQRRLIAPVLFLILCGFGLKGAIYHTVGAVAYEDRMQRLQAGQSVELVGAWLMQADPVTKFVADQIKAVLRELR